MQRYTRPPMTPAGRRFALWVISLCNLVVLMVFFMVVIPSVGLPIWTVPIFGLACLCAVVVWGRKGFPIGKGQADETDARYYACAFVSVCWVMLLTFLTSFFM